MVVYGVSLIQIAFSTSICLVVQTQEKTYSTYKLLALLYFAQPEKIIKQSTYFNFGIRKVHIWRPKVIRKWNEFGIL